MSRILMVSPVPTHPTTAGNRARLCSLKTALEESGHTIYFAHVEREAGDRAAMTNYWGDRYLAWSYQQPRSPARTLLRRVQRRLGLSSAYRYGLDEWYDEALSAQVQATIKALDIDALYVHYVFMSNALTAAPPNVLRLLDTHDAFANRHLKYLAAGMKPNWYACTPAAEAEGLNRADVAIAIQDQEANYFSGLTSSQVITVGHTVELAQPSADYPTNASMVTVGSANPINRKSTSWFIENVLPAVRQQVPGAILTVAGSVCDALNPAPGVELLGRVDDLSALYAQAQIIVNPMQLGTGLKIKSIEALGQGRALVTSPAGAEGLADGAGHAFIKAATAEEFIESIAGLLSDPTSAAALAAAGLDLAARYNSQCLTSLNAVLDHKQPGEMTQHVVQEAANDS